MAGVSRRPPPSPNLKVGMAGVRILFLGSATSAHNNNIEIGGKGRGTPRHLKLSIDEGWPAQHISIADRADGIHSPHTQGSIEIWVDGTADNFHASFLAYLENTFHQRYNLRFTFV